MTGTGFICLYDHQFKALGTWTQHVAKEWSLTRKAFEADDFSATCSDWGNSKNACFVGLHSPSGSLEYIAFCGIPVTKGKLTTVTGCDCRHIFNQNIRVALNKQNTSGTYAINDCVSLFTYLLKGVFSDSGISLGIDYEIDVSDTSFCTWNESAIARETSIANIWDLIQKFNAVYNTVMTVEWSVKTGTNVYALKFVVRRIYQSRALKLSDYDIVMKLNQNTVNRVVATDGSSSITYYLYNDNTVGTVFDASKCLFPPRIFTISSDDFSTAKAKAIDKLNDNRFQDRVTIDRTTKLGSTLSDLDFTFFGDLTGYNAADLSTSKRLPVSAIKTDSNGMNKVEFGRLSDYWFLEE